MYGNLHRFPSPIIDPIHEERNSNQLVQVPRSGSSMLTGVEFLYTIKFWIVRISEWVLINTHSALFSYLWKNEPIFIIIFVNFITLNVNYSFLYDCISVFYWNKRFGNVSRIYCQFQNCYHYLGWPCALSLNNL